MIARIMLRQKDALYLYKQRIDLFMEKIKYILPLLPLRGITVFPGMVIHFDVGRPQSIAAVKQAMGDNKLIFLCYQTDIDVEDPVYEDLADIGTIAEIHQILNLPDGNIRILVEGLTRGKITKYTQTESCAQVNVTKCIDLFEDDDTILQVLMRRTIHLVEDFMELYDRLSPEALSSLLAVDDPGELADVIVSNFPINPQAKQTILNELNVKARLEKLISILTSEIDILSLEKSIMSKVQKNMDKSQREYMLREKLKVIHEELGDDDEVDKDLKKYNSQLEGRNIPQEVKEKLNEEFNRLSRTHPNSQEYGVIQNYIETVIALPWGEKTEDILNIETASKILDRDHYGLNKVKERILEYIAVRSLGGNPKSNIICLVGPPGTGKTSIAKGLAEALGRKYVRISLGGVRNESEIRGHRKTYIGAMPGRIIDGLKKCGSENPLMLFDEIDKMSHDVTGDPASAMLEVLDPEQNKTFRDHFVELPFDLSEVLFVTTANTLETVPRPLLDRMDVIEVEGYTPSEKSCIAKKYLIPKQRGFHGLKTKDLKFNQAAIDALIDSYTRESGVRELERKISAICRKTARKIANNDVNSISVTKSNLAELLGNPPYPSEKADLSDKIGVVTGLAWTSVGGDTLCIEVNTMPGTGKLEITGNLGDVMQESAKAAFSYVRANAFKLGIKNDFYKNTDIHIHVPEGAVPKDGPSAGITITTALISALTGRAVHHEIAMTGEVTLRGRVLAIGGLKEKTLAAYRAGIKKIIIPLQNKPDYNELPDVVKKNISFVYADNMEDVYSVALLPEISKKAKSCKGKNSYIDTVTDTSEHNICTANIN